MEQVLDHEPVHSRARVEVPFVPEVKLALERALEEANALNHRFIRPEHLLVVLLRDESTEAWRTLNDGGAEPHHAVAPAARAWLGVAFGWDGVDLLAQTSRTRP
jgi:ATP-dependent Clp protease ATP-binding subunit ClpA